MTKTTDTTMPALLCGDAGFDPIEDRLFAPTPPWRLHVAVTLAEALVILDIDNVLRCI